MGLNSEHSKDKQGQWVGITRADSEGRGFLLRHTKRILAEGRPG